MNNNNAPSTRLSYFAAANGYSGFRSYFNKIFDPYKYTSLYILKGGPGTGKSSFMRRILTEVAQLGAKCESILCSSDSNSLDGVIIDYEGRRVGVIDGTAPHSCDPVLPGAIDKIINLGDNWNEKALADDVGSIKEITKNKSAYYKNAYDQLSVAGMLTQKADVLIGEIYTESINARIGKLLAGVTRGSRKQKIRLVTSFGKDGFGKLGTISDLATEVYSIVGIYGSEYVLMARIVDALRYIGADYTLFPSALDDAKTDAIFLPSIGLAFTTERSTRFSSEHIIDTSEHLDQRALSKNKVQLELLWRERETMLWSSTDEFKKASEEHFKLERIYSSAMDFSKNDEICGTCISEIKKILSL